MPAPLVLGPFVALAPLSAGGHGEVWRGEHQGERGERQPVAIKLVRAAQTSARRAAFQREVWALAGMNHPAVVAVYDAGEVPPEAATAEVPAGTPYLVMPLADRGSLADHLRQDTPWTDAALRTLLRAILEGLAHIHARGVIHRDIKPANILAFSSGAPWRLADLGIAYALQEDAEGAPVAAGTPGFMAPEQRQGQGWAWGPWTDLYAVGCVAWRLLAGQPYDATRPDAGTLDPALRAWLARLLAPEPRHRFGHAAAALAALEQLPPHALTGSAPTTTPLPSAATATATATETGTGTADEVPAVPLTAPVALVGAAWTEDWPEVPEPEPWLWLAGLRLYDLRERPLVGRADAQRALWAALRRVVEARTAAGVVLRGVAGTGKSRLARWLCEAAAERGGASPVRVVLSAGQADPVRVALRSLLRCAAMEAGALRWQLGARLGSEEPETLQALARYLGGAPVRASERRRLLLWVLRRVGGGVPAVLWLEDLHRDEDDPGLAGWLLQQDAPVLVLVTVQEEALAERPGIAAALAALPAERAETLVLGPLARQHWQALVQGLLGLAGPLAAAVEEHAAGNPLLAAQLVGDWVQQGVLAPAQDGFRLHAGASLAGLPADLGAVWGSRLAALLADHPPEALEALELAALLGHEVDGAEWAAACRSLGVPVPHALVATLARLHLIEGADLQAGWRFVHGMLRESLCARSRAAGRAERLHRAAAEMLRTHAGEERRAERRGLHLLAAGALEEALQPLLQGAIERLFFVETRQARGLLEQREGALAGLGLPTSDPRWAEGWVRLALLDIIDGRQAEALAWLARASAAADPEDPAWLGVLAQVELHRARIFRQQLRLEEALAEIHRARARAAQIGHVEREAQCAVVEGEIHLTLRQYAQAAAVLRWARGQDCSTVTRQGAARALSEALGKLGAWAESVALLEEELQSESWGPEGRGMLLNALGDSLRYMGRLDDAEARLLAAREELDRVASGNAILPRLNLPLVYSARGNIAAADAAWEALLGWIRVRPAQHPMLATVLLSRLPCRAQLGAWDAWAAELAEGARRVETGGRLFPESVELVEQAARHAADAGALVQAQEALRLAVALWGRLERPEDVRRAQAALQALAG